MACGCFYAMSLAMRDRPTETERYARDCAEKHKHRLCVFTVGLLTIGGRDTERTGYDMVIKMYENLVEALRLCVKYHKPEDALANAEQAAQAIETLSQENKFLKSMQRQLAKDVPLSDLGIMAFRSIKGE